MIDAGTRLVAPLAIGLLLTLTAASAAQTPPGTFGVAKDRGFTLTPPFPRGKEYRITRAYNFDSHNNEGTQDRFALDFDLPQWTPVFPAAPGKVRIANSVFDNGDHQDEGFHPYGKFVLVEHVNGYFTMYAHLDNIDVGVDDWVDIDTQIATSGMSGYGANNDPHLHFVLYKGVTGIVSSPPVSYSSGTAVVPEPFAGCTKQAGGDCENLLVNQWLRRDDFAPAVTIRGGVLDLVTCNRSQQKVMHLRRDAGGAWSSQWTNLDGVCASSPSIVRDGAAGGGNLFVFVRGVDGKVYYKILNTSGVWSSTWAATDGFTIGRPTAALDTVASRIRLFVRRPSPAGGMATSVYVASQQSLGGASFGTWKNLGGTLTNAPVAGTHASGRVDVYAAAPDYTLWKIPGNSDGTHSYEFWHPQYVAIEGEPSIVAHGTLEWAARSTGDKLLFLSTAIQNATHRPAIARNKNGSLYLFERNRTTSAADYIYSSGGWQRKPLDGLVTSELAAIRGTASRVIMFTWGTSGLYSREQTTPDTHSWYDWDDLDIPQ